MLTSFKEKLEFIIYLPCREILKQNTLYMEFNATLSWDPEEHRAVSWIWVILRKVFK